MILLSLSFLFVGCSPQPQRSNAHFSPSRNVSLLLSPSVGHSWWNLHCCSLAFTWLWACIIPSFPPCPPCSVSEVLQVWEPGVLSTVTFLPTLVARQLVIRGVFIALWTASQPQVGDRKTESWGSTSAGCPSPTALSVHPRQSPSNARATGQLNGVAANAATVEAWLFSKMKQNRVF